MSTISLRIPDSLHRRVKELAQVDQISINQFIATALAEKISALMAVEYLEERARRGSRRKFERALSKVKDVSPDDFDEM
jgi:predicted transcriptional regulator